MLFFSMKDFSVDIRSVRECLKHLKQLETSDGYALPEPDTKQTVCDGITVTFPAYAPGAVSTRIWEAHRAFADVHILLKGEEDMQIGYVPEMKAGEYQPQKDFLPLEGTEKTVIRLTPGYGVLLLPNDAHKVGIAVPGWHEGKSIRKAMFKIDLSVHPELLA